MTSKFQFKRVGQASNVDDIATARAELVQAINSLQGDAFTALRAQLNENLKGIDELIAQRTNLITQRRNAEQEISKLNEEIKTLETQKQTVANVGITFNNAVNKLKSSLNI